MAEPCTKCAKYVGSWEWFGKVFCIDCWPGYDLCKACNDYRCEHLIPDAQDLIDPNFRSCHCRNRKCAKGFVEGSTRRIVTQAEFAKLIERWRKESLPAPPQAATPEGEQP